MSTVAWLFGTPNPGAETRRNDRDRPPLSYFLDQVRRRQSEFVSSNESDACQAGTVHLRTSFQQVPFGSIGLRIDGSVELASTCLGYYEERSKQLQRTLKDLRKKPPSFAPQSEFTGGSLERALFAVTHLHENEVGNAHARASAYEQQLKSQLAMARDNVIACGSDYEGELNRAEREVAKARDRLQRSKTAVLKTKEKLAHAKRSVTRHLSPSTTIPRPHNRSTSMLVSCCLLWQGPTRHRGCWQQCAAWSGGH